MRKEEIYVVIDSEEKRLRALDILEKAGEEVYKYFLDYKYLKYHEVDCDWFATDEGCIKGLTEITIDQLEQLLIPMSQLDQLKQQAEALGYELVEKKREIKVGDFGVFWDDDGENKYLFSVISKIEGKTYFSKFGAIWQNFRHLTEEEKQQIQNNW